MAGIYHLCSFWPIAKPGGRTYPRGMDLYPEAAQPALDPGLFAAPPARYRGAPFWSWNTAMGSEYLAMLDDYRAMGMGGACLHPRTGLATPYLGAEFMDLVRQSADHCARDGQLLWLYDEDRWPSGSAGGLVTRDSEEHRQQAVVFTRVREEDAVIPDHGHAPAFPHRSGCMPLLATYAVRKLAGATRAVRRVTADASLSADEERWYAYAGTVLASRWFNHGTYADTLSPAAMEAFVATTHERYRTAVGEHFGRTIPAIFTDEPQIACAGQGNPGPSESGKDLLLPWTPALPELWLAAGHGDLLDALPGLIFDLADDAHVPIRWRWWDLIAGRFAESFAGTLGRWCAANGIALTGHLMSEDSLSQQTMWTGESMRSYPHMQIPGIDLLCDEVEWCFTTAKQVQSVVRQQGGKAMLSELYGVTGWHFDFQGHKRQGDWQAALGVTVRIHHLSWASMAGEAKRDYPAPIDRHSPWWREYALVENHYARLNTALVRGTPICRVAVVHPVEGAWIAMGPADGSGRVLGELDQRHFDLTRWLLNGLIDFDFLAESLLPGQQARAEGARLRVGAAVYDVVVLPHLATIRRSTLDLLQHLHAAGVRILILGSPPRWCEGRPDPALDWLAHLPAVTWNGADILAALEPQREIRSRNADGESARSLVSQVRQDGDARWAYVCCSDRSRSQGAITLAVRGRWQIERWDSLTGTRSAVASRVVDGWTEWTWICEAAGHELVRLQPRHDADAGTLEQAPVWTAVAALSGEVAVTLDEPNVLLLDRAAWRLSEGAWEAEEELLRVDNLVRARCGLEPVCGEISQPWCDAPAPPVARVQLRFHFRSEIALRGVRLAVEHLAETRIVLDGMALTATADGHWVDLCLATVPLPDLTAGVHEIILEQPVSGAHTREWAYLLGDFGVRLDDERRVAVITAAPRSLHAGDWADQGLPFYAGNATLHFSLSISAGGDYALDLPGLRAPLARVALNGRDLGPIAFAPRRLDLGRVEAGAHELTITVFGHRANAFGPVHLADPGHCWLGPNAYRTNGAAWTDDWRLQPWGLIRAPRLLQPGQPAIATFHDAISAWLVDWQVSTVRRVDLATLTPPSLDDVAWGWHPIPPTHTFVNCHTEWIGLRGVAVLVHAIERTEGGPVTLRLGYDGPVRVFCNGHEVFADPHGTNPAIADSHSIPLQLAAGHHILAVAIDINDGKAWGIYTRLA